MGFNKKQEIAEELSRKAGTLNVDAADAGSTTAADAATQTASYVQADVQSIATLANELKADYNAAVTLINELKADLNSLLDKLQDKKDF